MPGNHTKTHSLWRSCTRCYVWTVLIGYNAMKAEGGAEG